MLIYRYRFFNCKAISVLKYFFLFVFKVQKKKISSGKFSQRLWHILIVSTGWLGGCSCLFFIYCCSIMFATHLMMPLSWQVHTDSIYPCWLGCPAWKLCFKIVELGHNCTWRRCFHSYSIAALWDALTSVTQEKHRKPRELAARPHLLQIYHNYWTGLDRHFNSMHKRIIALSISVCVCTCGCIKKPQQTTTTFYFCSRPWFEMTL